MFYLVYTEPDVARTGVPQVHPRTHHSKTYRGTNANGPISLLKPLNTASMEDFYVDYVLRIPSLRPCCITCRRLMKCHLIVLVNRLKTGISVLYDLPLTKKTLKLLPVIKMKQNN